MARSFGYTSVQPLERIVLIKTATLFWNPIHSFKLNNFQEFKERWSEIEEKIKENVHRLELPKTHIEQLISLVKPVGFQILKWIEYHSKNIPILLPDEFYWTQRGTIDAKKTAESLIQKERLAAHIRYKLASIYCLDNYIRILWEVMDKRQQNMFYDARCFTPLAIYWMPVMSSSATKGINPLVRETIHARYTHFHTGFLYSAESGNVAATRYFFEKLTPEERKDSLVHTANKVARKHCNIVLREPTDFTEVHFSEVLVFLLLEMNGEELKKVLKTVPWPVLHCLNEWFWKDILLETLNQMWDFLNKHEYISLLRKIVNRQVAEFGMCIYKQFFTDVWQQTPEKFKKCIASLCLEGHLLGCLFLKRDRKNIKLIFIELNAEERKKVLFSDKGLTICHEIVGDGAWDLLQFFVKECVSSKSDIVEFKEAFINYRNMAGRMDKFLEAIDRIMDEFEHAK